MTTLAEFTKMVESHDLTHAFSDDHRWWHQGSKELALINTVAKEFPRETVVNIWNEAVDRKMSPSAREMFYWKE